MAKSVSRAHGTSTGDEPVTTGSDLGVSDAAWQRYRGLVENGPAERVDAAAPEDLDVVERELVGARLAQLSSVNGRRTLAALAPSSALNDVVAARARGVRAAHDRLLGTYREIESLQRMYERNQDRPALHGLVTILTNPGEIKLLSARLVSSAEWDYSAWQSGPNHPTNTEGAVILPVDPAVVERGVRSRQLCEAEDLAGPGALDAMRELAERGDEVRSIPVLPSRMVVVDESAALLPLLPTGVEGAVLITATYLVRALRVIFDEYWKQGVPLGMPTAPAEPGPGLTPVQRRVVTLLIAGWKDEAISRHMGTSTRTVRRHIQEVLDVLGADSRLQAGAELVRRGWIE